MNAFIWIWNWPQTWGTWWYRIHPNISISKSKLIHACSICWHCPSHFCNCMCHSCLSSAAWPKYSVNISHVQSLAERTAAPDAWFFLCSPRPVQTRRGSRRKMPQKEGTEVMWCFDQTHIHGDSWDSRARRRDMSHYRQRQSQADTPRGRATEARRVVMHFPWLTALSHLMFY